MTVRVLGLDLSLTSTGVATAISGQDASVYRIRTAAVAKLDVPGRDKPLADVRGAQHRYRAIADAIANIARRGSQLDLVLIEGAMYGMGGAQEQYGTDDRTELACVVKDRLCDVAPILLIAPGTLKAWATGNGHAGKDEVLSTMTMRHGYAFTKNDEADAMALLTLGLCMLEPQLYEPGYSKKQVLVARKWAGVAAQVIAAFGEQRVTPARVTAATVSCDPRSIAAARSEQQKALF
jgi:Holliday junction resolvasome RuvABC endonuclease subunit